MVHVLPGTGWEGISFYYATQDSEQYKTYEMFLKALFIFRESGREGGREGDKHQCAVASHVPPAGDLARNPGMCPDWESNWRPFGSQAGTQSTEPHQPVQNLRNFYFWNFPFIISSPRLTVGN